MGSSIAARPIMTPAIPCSRVLMFAIDNDLPSCLHARTADRKIRWIGKALPGVSGMDDEVLRIDALDQIEVRVLLLLIPIQTEPELYRDRKAVVMNDFHKFPRPSHPLDHGALQSVPDHLGARAPEIEIESPEPLCRGIEHAEKSFQSVSPVAKELDLHRGVGEDRDPVSGDPVPLAEPAHPGHGGEGEIGTVRVAQGPESIIGDVLHGGEHEPE